MISAIAISFNNEDVIERFIKNIDFADEIIIIDALSSDKTSEIANTSKVKVIANAYDSLDKKIRNTFELAQNDWILFCHVSDQISKNLAQEIKQQIQQNATSNAFKIHSEFYFMGKRMKYGGYKNLNSVKIINKGHIKFKGYFEAQPFIIHGKTNTLNHACKDLSYIDFDTFNAQLTLESKARAAQLYKNNLRPNLYHLLLKPFGKFVRHYIDKLGALDGKQGFILSYLLAFAEFKCYLYLWLTYRNID